MLGNWLFLIASITFANLWKLHHMDTLISLLFCSTGASTGIWLGDKFCKWIGPHIWNGIQEELRKPR